VGSVRGTGGGWKCILQGHIFMFGGGHAELQQQMYSRCTEFDGRFGVIALSELHL
jgi:hypothetical protein